MIGAIADRIVGVVRAGHRHKAWLSGGALVLVLVVGLAYLSLGALRWNPLRPVYRVTMELPRSGGLLTNQNVTLRGVPIGRVESLELAPTGVNARLRLESTHKISASSRVQVSELSAAGEQFVDFDGGDGKEPFLGDGSTVALGNATVPKTMAQMLNNADGALRQVDVDKLEIMKKELSMSKEGPQKLTDIVEGGTFLLSTLDSVLPQTTSMLKTTRILMTLVADKNAGLKVSNQNLDQVLTGVNKMTNGFRVLTEQGPKTMSAMDSLFADNSDTMVQLLGSMLTTSQLMYLRVPALNALWPDYRPTSLLDALGSTMRDHGLWSIGDIYPRYNCDYGTPRAPVSAAEYPEAPLYTYCRDTDPQVLVRGAKNAPRPAGDDTAGPPMGADLGKMTDPTPKGRYSVPTPQGGPVLPIEPPQ